MSHVHRLCTSDRIFFVTINLRRALAPLRASEYAKLIAAIDASRAKLGFKLNGYVLMPDHWHALLWTGYPLTISRAAQDIKWLSARELNGLRGTSGAVWQHQFWDRFVRHGKEFNDRLMYMHLNPVRKGLATRPEKWQWSSYNNFARDEATVMRCPIRVDYVLLPEGYRA